MFQKVISCLNNNTRNLKKILLNMDGKNKHNKYRKYN